MAEPQSFGVDMTRKEIAEHGSVQDAVEVARKRLAKVAAAMGMEIHPTSYEARETPGGVRVWIPAYEVE